MQPKLMTLEPIYLLSLGALTLIVPAVCLVVWKLRPVLRAVFAGCAVVLLSLYFLWLGEAVGRSKAWVHWSVHYQAPLESLQFFLAAKASKENTSALLEFSRQFEKENVTAYGREPLFEESQFEIFIRRFTEQNQKL